MNIANPEPVRPLLPMQRDILLYSLAEPRSGAGVQQVVCLLRSPLDIVRFQRAWERVAERHWRLRASFRWMDGSEPLQRIHPHADIRIEQDDWSSLPAAAQGEALERFLAADRRRGFDFAAAPLMRLALFRLDAGAYRFVWTTHQLLVDVDLRLAVLREVFETYGGAAPRRVEEAADAAVPAPAGEVEAFWREALDGFAGPTPLGLDAPHRGAGDAFGFRETRLAPAATAVVSDAAARSGLSVESVVDGAWALLLGRYSGEEDVVFGAAAGGSLVPVRARIAGQGALIPWLRALAAAKEAARPYAHTPLASIQEWCGLARGTALFDSVVLTERFSGAALQEAGRALGAREFRVLEQTGYPLTLRAHPGAELTLGISYDRARFDDAAAERILHDLALVVQGIAATPEPHTASAFFLMDREIRQQLAAWNSAPSEPLHASVHQVVAEHAARAPDSVALVFEGEPLTYGELNRRANRLAHHLLSMGVGPDTPVGLLVERSAEMVVGALGILKAGAAYVPLDPAYPPSRIQLTLIDAQPSVVVTQERLAAMLDGSGVPVVALDGVELLGSANEHDPAAPSAPESLAYVIYTSGSTGRPKGVMVTHGNLRHYLPAIASATGVTADDVYLHTASIAFSSSVRQLFVPLSLGGTVVMASRREVGDPRLLLETVKERGATVVDLVPSYWRNCVEVLEAADAERRAELLDNRLRLVLSASEPLPAELPRRWAALGHPAAVANMFGQTETSGIATVFPVRDLAELHGPVVPIGRPIAGTQIYLLDAHGRAVPAGVAGELYIGGVQVARGYLGRAELTADRFVADPFSAGPGARLYRTGDLARFRADGTLEFLGRGDNQVKIRGFRVETEEVDATLRRHTGVREALVTARRDDTGDQRLVAYVAGDAGAAELRAFLRGTLPDYMVPSAFVALPALPRTPNGKVDRAALPAPELLRSGLGGGYLAPRTPVEEILAGIWAEVLGVDRVGVEDNFFELGGHSLLAVRAATRIRAALRTELPMRRLFETPTIAALVDALRPAEPLPPIVPVADRGAVPLSSGQQRLWVINQMDPQSAAYNLGAALRLTGELDAAALERTLTEVVRRHESLRTVFPTVDGAAVQRVLPASPVALTTEPASGDVARLVADEVERPFDLAAGPLFRARLFRVGAREHVLVMAMHHIISDGWSRGVLYGEISALYPAFAAGAASPLPELPIQYADFAEWQRQGVPGSQLAYWKERLGGSLPKLDLPTDRPRPPVQTSHGATLGFALPESLAAGVRALCTREEVTPYMALMAAFQTLLSRYSGQEEILVGSPVAGRSRTEAEGLIGFFVNTVVLRTDLSGNPTFRELLGRVRDGALGAYENQDVPFEQVVDVVQAERDLSRSPLFQVMFILQNTPAAAVTLGEVRVEALDAHPRAAKFDLTLSITAGERGLACNLEYNTDLFDAGTIERLAGHFRILLEAAVADPAQPIASLPLLTAGEREQLLTTWNQTDADYPRDRCIHQLFEEQAARTPQNVAVVFRDRELTYAELDARANRLARHLRGLGVGPGTIVGVCAERSLELMVGLMGILKAGGAYLPLDPAYPADRVAFMLEDSAAPVLLTQERLLGRLPAGHGAHTLCLDRDWPAIAAESAEAPAPSATPDDLAYTIYTSGSTGKPKGVMVQHGNAVNFFTGMDPEVATEAPGVWLAVTSISFDISVLELFWTLTRGYKVILQGDDDRAPAAPRPEYAKRTLDFSLFYFGGDGAADRTDKYRLLMEGARFADRNGFSAVWTPERHFHQFGGLFPNPSVVGAAIAAVTQRIQIRAGSVVLPLHSPVRVAEEWSVVDNISGGRVGISVASGWHDRDFVFQPENYARRKEVMFEGIETVRRLWRGEKVVQNGGAGTPVEISILPKPIQKELPIWVTAAGSPETYIQAGQSGAHLLTHLLGQSVDQLREKIALYREAWRAAGHTGEGHVALMMHTFVGTDVDEVRALVRTPFREYLRTSVDLIRGLAQGRGQDMRSADFTAEDMEALLDHAFERYFETSALMGTPQSCLAMVDRLKSMGVDEVACLIDFGVDEQSVVESLGSLAELRERSNPAAAGEEEDYTIPAQLRRHGVTHLQCTPSMATMLVAQEEARAAMTSLEVVMIGGEAFPTALAAELGGLVKGRIVNMYGPTETTIWSATHRVQPGAASIPIGRPIANTELYVLDRQLQPVPVGVAGELLIGGAGVVRGYLGRPELTAERFIKHPFRGQGRLYRTGDLARFRPDGTVEFLGRIDHQIKIRGYRIELGEIESLLNAHPAVREAVVIVREDVPGDKRLVAYLVARAGAEIDAGELRELLRGQLPEYMVPAHFVTMAALPLTPNAKVDRKALPAPDRVAPSPEAAYQAPASELERAVAEIWTEVLGVERVGIRDNFFDLGGHSLLTVRVHSRLRAAVAHNVTITDLFRFPTIQSLVAHLAGAGAAQQPAAAESRQRADTRRDAMMRRRQSRQHTS